MMIYKILSRSLWSEAQAAGALTGAPVDLKDGYIHFSTATQVRETAAKHFQGQSDLLIVAIDSEALGPQLKWEVSRGGALFPHLYAKLPVSAAKWVRDLPWTPAGHEFPPLED